MRTRFKMATDESTPSPGFFLSCPAIFLHLVSTPGSIFAVEIETDSFPSSSPHTNCVSTLETWPSSSSSRSSSRRVRIEKKERGWRVCRSRINQTASTFKKGEKKRKEKKKRAVGESRQAVNAERRRRSWRPTQCPGVARPLSRQPTGLS